MGAIVLLRLLEQVDLPQGALVHELLQADVLGGKAELLGVHQLDALLLAGGDHRVGFPQVQAERLLADHVLAGARRVHRPLAVQPVGDAEDDQVHLRQVEQRPIVGEPARDLMLAGELADMRLVGRGDGHEARVRHLGERLRVNAAHKLRADDPNPNFFHVIPPGAPGRPARPTYGQRTPP